MIVRSMYSFQSDVTCCCTLVHIGLANQCFSDDLLVKSHYVLPIVRRSSRTVVAYPRFFWHEQKTTRLEHLLFLCISCSSPSGLDVARLRRLCCFSMLNSWDNTTVLLPFTPKPAHDDIIFPTSSSAHISRDNLRLTPTSTDLTPKIAPLSARRSRSDNQQLQRSRFRDGHVVVPCGVALAGA